MNANGMTTHELKTWPDMFAAIRNGTKTFELRKNDRDYKVGDVLLLREFLPCSRCSGTGKVKQLASVEHGHDVSYYDFCGCLNSEHPKGCYTGCSESRTVSFVLSGWGMKDGYVALGLARPIPASSEVPSVKELRERIRNHEPIDQLSALRSIMVGEVEKWSHRALNAEQKLKESDYLRHHASLKITGKEEGDNMPPDAILNAIDAYQKRGRVDYERIQELKKERDSLADWKNQAVIGGIVTEPFFKTPEEYEDFKSWWQENVSKRLLEDKQAMAQQASSQLTEAPAEVVEQLVAALAGMHDACVVQGAGIGSDVYNRAREALATYRQLQSAPKGVTL